MATLQLSSDLGQLTRLKAWLEEQLPTTLDEQKKNHILLVTHELCANAITHGNHTDKQKFVDISLAANAKQITITISDSGKGDYTLPTKEEASNMNYLEENGRGLKLAVHLTKEITKENNVLKLIFDI